jgi:5-hydroxyisourate hydrolase
MSAITTHVLDTARGRPAGGVPIQLEVQEADGSWRMLGSGATDGDGRLRDLLPGDFDLQPGIYRLIFDTAAYFEAHSLQSFYPHVSIVFLIHDVTEHYHVPLLVSPYGYSTYRGS